jgi:hypothetical protein
MGRKKRAKKKLRQAQAQIEQGLSQAQINDSIPGNGADFGEISEAVVGDVKTNDIPDVPFQPAFPYSGRQIILDSGRLHLNAKDDFVLLMAKKSISLSAKDGSINFDTDNSVIVNANKIKLGIGENSDHPLVYGDELVNLILTMAQFFQQVADALSEAEDSIGGKSAEDKIASKNLSKLSKIMVSKTATLNSQQNFTK